MLCLRNMDIAVEGNVRVVKVEVDFGRETPEDFSQQSLRIYIQALRVQLGSCLAKVLDSSFITTHLRLRARGSACICEKKIEAWVIRHGEVGKWLCF